jgi:hypothetical protein
LRPRNVVPHERCGARDGGGRSARVPAHARRRQRVA